MKNYSAMTPSNMHAINRTAVMEHIRKSGASSRAVISRDLSLSLPSVVRITDEMIVEKYLRYSGEFEASGGRKRALLEMNTEENLVIAIDLGGTKIYACSVDFGGKIYFEESIPCHATTGEACYSLIEDLVDVMITKAKFLGKILRGVALGVPGVTDQDNGVVFYAPSLGWRDLPVQKRLQERFHVPVVVENDVNMAALGEMWFGAGKTAFNAILIAMGTGLGAGVIINGMIYRGSSRASGELGYLIFEKDQLRRNYPEFGPLEYSVAGMGLTEKAKEALINAGETARAESVTCEELFECALNRKEPWAVTLIDEFVEKLAMTIIASCAMFDPEIVMLSGGVMRSAEAVLDRVKNLAAGKTPSTARIEVSQLKEKATIYGGVVCMIYRALEYSAITPLF